MTAYIILNSIALLGLCLTCLYLFYKQKDSELNQNPQLKNLNDSLSSITNLDWKVKVLLAMALILVLISFASPFLFTRISINNDFNFRATGQIGDTIGGLMNPFIALAGVIVTGLAFYIQYKANLQQRELFIKGQEESNKQLQIQIDNQNKQTRRQPFESQFYEMLKLHRENINEMKINGYDFEEGKTLKKFEKVTEGRKEGVCYNAN